jgi:hypothetical protein
MPPRCQFVHEALGCYSLSIAITRGSHKAGSHREGRPSSRKELSQVGATDEGMRKRSGRGCRCLCESWFDKQLPFPGSDFLKPAAGRTSVLAPQC